MRAMIFAIALLFATQAVAQDRISTIIKPESSQSTTYSVSARSALTLTTTSTLRGIRVTCTTACWISVATGSASMASSATGVYLPADEPVLISTGGNRVVEVTAATSAGTISVTEF